MLPTHSACFTHIQLASHPSAYFTHIQHASHPTACHSKCIITGKEEPVPEHPYPGQQWKEVRHDKTVTWLAYWKEPIAQKDFKYVWLAANSTFKSDSDLAKYEKARKLKVPPFPSLPPPPQSRPICTPFLYLCLCVCACRCRLALTSQCFSTDAPTPLAVLKRCRESMPQAELMPQYTGLTPHVLLYRIMWMTSARCMRRTGTARIHSASRWAVLSTSLTSWPCELVMKRMRTRQTLLAAVPSRFGLLLPAVAADSSILVQTDHASVCLSQLPISVVMQCCT